MVIKSIKGGVMYPLVMVCIGALTISLAIGDIEAWRYVTVFVGWIISVVGASAAGVSR